MLRSLCFIVFEYIIYYTVPVLWILILFLIQVIVCSRGVWGQATYNPSTIVLFRVPTYENPRNSTLTDRICHIWRKIKIDNISILLQFAVIVHLTENELIAQNALSRCHYIFLFCVYRQPLSLSVVVWIFSDKISIF